MADAGVNRKLSAFLQQNTYPTIGAIDNEFVECFFATYSGVILYVIVLFADFLLLH